MRVLVLTVIAVVAGCASQPETTTAPAPVIAAAPAVAPAPAAAPTSVQPAQSAGDEQTVFKPPPGYRLRKQGATTVYCKKETILGSRFPEEFCFTEEQLKDVVRRGEEQGRDAAKHARVCSSAGNCGGE
jgi:hypothetical protein